MKKLIPNFQVTLTDLNAPLPSSEIRDGWYADLHIKAFDEEYTNACLEIFSKDCKRVSLLAVSLFAPPNPFLLPRSTEELIQTARKMIAAIKSDPTELDRMEAYQDSLVP